MRLASIHPNEIGFVATPATWEKHLSQLLKNEIKRNLQSYESLAQALGEPKQNVINKINRGKFSAVFLCQALNALGVKQLDIPNLSSLKPKKTR